LLLAMGVHVKVVQELLGHSNILITLNTYSHVLPSLHEKAMDELSTLFDYEIDRDYSHLNVPHPTTKSIE
jgi:integrase